MNKDVPKYGLELYKINKYKRIWKQEGGNERIKQLHLEIEKIYEKFR